MIKKNPEIEIDENNIFKNDKLQRKDSIEDLSKLIISNTEPLVLSINASWGSGKTTFVKLWQTYLKKERNVNSIYFSAWEDDFSKEPLISILGEMNSYIEKIFGVNTPISNGFNKAIYNLINKQIGGAELKNIVLSIFKDDNLYRDVSVFFENLIDSTGKNNEEYNQLIQKQKKELERRLSSIKTISVNEVEKEKDETDNKDRLEYLIKKLQHGYDDCGEYKLNNLIETVIKKIEFADKFNFETV